MPAAGPGPRQVARGTAVPRGGGLVAGGPPADLAGRLVPVATDLVIRVREEGRDSVGELLGQLTDPERWALPVILAAMVDPGAPVGDLLCWVIRYASPVLTGLGRPLRPCGTHAAFVRHKARGEPVDVACADAERAYQRSRRRRSRRRAP